MQATHLANMSPNSWDKVVIILSHLPPFLGSKFLFIQKGHSLTYSLPHNEFFLSVLSPTFSTIVFCSCTVYNGLTSKSILSVPNHKVWGWN